MIIEQRYFFPCFVCAEWLLKNLIRLVYGSALLLTGCDHGGILEIEPGQSRTVRISVGEDTGRW